MRSSVSEFQVHVPRMHGVHTSSSDELLKVDELLNLEDHLDWANSLSIFVTSEPTSPTSRSSRSGVSVLLLNVLIREFIYRRSVSEASDTHLNSEIQEFISPVFIGASDHLSAYRY